MYMYIVGREREEEAGLQSLHRDSAATRAGSACKMGVWSVAVAMALSGASPVESCIAMSKASPGPAFAEQALLARGLLGHERLTFDAAAHEGLREAVAMTLDCPSVADLGQWHLHDAARRAASPDALPKKVRRLFAAQGKASKPHAAEALRVAYDAFVSEWAAPHVAAWYGGDLEKVYVQTSPSLRVSVPGKTTGRRHRDRDYGHQPGQLNFWLPLAGASGSSVLFVEQYPPSPGGTRRERRSAAMPLEGDFGCVHRFYGNGAYHFTKPNEEAHTRVSLDFRAVPGPLYEDDYEASRHPPTGAQQFFLGGYYAEVLRVGDAWSLVRSGP